MDFEPALVEMASPTGFESEEDGRLANARRFVFQGSNP